MAFTDFLKGILPGAGTTLGGIFGGPLGGILGNLGGQFIGSLFGESETPYQKTAREAQMNLLNQLNTPSQFNRVDFSPIRQQELQRFETQTLPGIAERFAGRSSGAFQQALSGAGGDLATRLASLEAQHNVGQQGAEQTQQGINLSRLGQLQGFLNQDQQRAMQQQLLRQQQAQGLFGLGQQAFGGSLGQQGGLLSQRLGALQSGAGLSTGRQFENLYQPGQPGFLGRVPEYAYGLGRLFV